MRPLPTTIPLATPQPSSEDPDECGPIRVEHGRGGGAVRAHYDRVGFFFADWDAARRVFHAYSQLGALLRSAEANDGPLVDVGCGEGRTYASLSDTRQRRWLGLDLSSGNLRRVRQRFGHVPAVQADATALPLKTESAALVVCQGVLHHTADPRGAFAELVRIMRPRGVIQLSVYNRRSFYFHAFRLLGPVCHALSGSQLGRATLAITLFPIVYLTTFAPAHLAYGVVMPIRGAWTFFLDQYAHPRVWFFRRRGVLAWAAAHGLEPVDFQPELAGWMLSFVFRKRNRPCGA
jgi:SAM-dependent methyltransferase